jgi:hypothetical protein
VSAVFINLILKDIMIVLGKFIQFMYLVQCCVHCNIKFFHDK